MKYGLIGEKLGHSFSKIIHNRLFDYEYEIKELAREEVADFINSREFEAINVTIPYKETVIPYLDGISETAAAIGAVNTVINREGKLFGDNTDFCGMLALIERAGITLKDKKVLILGSGGTSKTAKAVAESLGCADVQKVSLYEEADCISYKEAATRKDTRIIINTTPCGMFPKIGESAVDVTDFPMLEGVVDAVYNPLRSKLVCDAQKLGIPAVGGLYMLVAQAAAAAERFVGTSVDTSKVDAIYNGIIAEKQNIVLVGMPGSGKSTVGKLLAEKLGLEFIDTDEEIVRREGRGITEIFAKEGQEGFRDVESEVVFEVSARQGAVIATGGGVILREKNVDMLKENGRLYFLDRPLEELLPSEDRPLSTDREALEKRYSERYSLYCSACDVRVAYPETPEAAAEFIQEDAYGEDTCY